MGSQPKISGSETICFQISFRKEGREIKNTADNLQSGWCASKAVVLMKQNPGQQNQCMPFPPALAFVSVQAHRHSSAGTAAWPLGKSAQGTEPALKKSTTKPKKSATFSSFPK